MNKNKESKNLDKIFHALSDSTRRALLDQLSVNESTISELAEPFDMTFAAVSKHVRVLEEAGLISRSIDGRVHRCSADFENLQVAMSYIEKYRKFWGGQLNVLDEYLKKQRKR